MNVFAHPELIAMVVPIFIEVTMSMVVMVVVAVASEAKIAITTESSSESTKTPGQGGSLVKACSDVRLVICLLVVFYMMVIFIVVHMALIMVVLGLGQTLVVSTRPAARRHHHQNRQNLSFFISQSLELSWMRCNKILRMSVLIPTESLVRLSYPFKRNKLETVKLQCFMKSKFSRNILKSMITCAHMTG